LKFSWFFPFICGALLAGAWGSLIAPRFFEKPPVEDPGEGEVSSPPEPVAFESLGLRAFPNIPSEYFTSLNGTSPVFAEASSKGEGIPASDADPLTLERVRAFFGMLIHSEDLAEILLSNARVYRINPALAFALCWEESRYNPRAVNRWNSDQTVDRGLFQLNSDSFPNLTEEEFFDPRVNAYYGMAHLRWCLDTGGTEVSGLAMYNAGIGRVRSRGAPKSTLDYISRILENRRKIEDLFSSWNRLNSALAPKPPELKPPLAFLGPSGRP
jgi:hypothetical protein